MSSVLDGKARGSYLDYILAMHNDNDSRVILRTGYLENKFLLSICLAKD